MNNRIRVKNKNQNSGITLIALVVTIVVLIILATVSINAVFSENGIIKKAELAKGMHANAIKSDEESMNTLLEEYNNAMSEPELPITLIEIEITTPPTKTTYTAGENFELNGMIVTAKYSDGSSKIITNYIVTDGTNLTKGKNSINISYTENNIEKNVTQNIIVNAKIISFTIDGTSYQAEEGMTFEQWINSEIYDSGTFQCTSGHVQKNSDYILCHEGGNQINGYVHPSDIVSEGEKYYTQYF